VTLKTAHSYAVSSQGAGQVSAAAAAAPASNPVPQPETTEV
jgi:hypothetical protein